MKHHFSVTAFLCTVILLFAACVFSGCKSKETEPIQKTGMLLDTVIGISIYDSDNEKLLDKSFDLCKTYETLFSPSITTSDIYKINHSGGAPVTVSDATLEVIQKGIAYGERSDGLFDITIAPLSELWDFDHNTGTIPDPDAIREAASHVNYQNIQIDGNQVCLSDPQSGIDLGGIAKGYIADRIRDYLKSEGVKSAVINLGGNVLTLGGRPDGSPFRIGIRKPFSEDSESIAIAKVRNTSLVSSGNYQRYFKKDGKIYHHILNPQTGYPIDNTLYQVTILCDTSEDADALSTICYSLGLEKGLEFINSIPDVEALFVTSDEKLHPSDGWDDAVN